MYVANLRDMCDFDPNEVGIFLQEIRTLAASAEEVVRRLKIRPSQEDIPPNMVTISGAANTEPRGRDGTSLTT